MYRYGGLSFGEINDLVLVNQSDIEERVRRIVEAANGGKEVGGSVEIPDVISDLEVLLENLATKRNVKVRV